MLFFNIYFDINIEILKQISHIFKFNSLKKFIPKKYYYYLYKEFIIFA